jgi:UDPglucose 6-dehydrogenase
MKITIIGAGYVGLVSGICFSDFGHNVICIDKDQEKIDQLNAGKIPIYEPGLEALLKKNVQANRLSFSSTLSDAIDQSDAVFLAVGTPSRRGDGSADLTYVVEATKEIAKLAKKYILFITKSTVPVGTNRELLKLISSTNPTLDFDIASNPEFLREGSAIEDFQKPDRVIVGVESSRAKNIISEIYKPLYLKDFPIIYTSLESAEIIKYASNAFLATKISFVNEIAALSEKAGGDIKDISKAMGLDGRIGSKFLHAGPGYGGSCFPKDTSALVETAKKFNTDMLITKSVIESNHKTKLRMIEKIINLSGGSVEDKVLTILGITFKPNTDDLRDAPSLLIVPALVKLGAKVRLVDPKGRDEGLSIFKNAEWFDDVYDAAVDSSMIIILTEWNEFRALDLNRIAHSMRNAAMADLRNIYSAQKVFSEGFIAYDSVGQKPHNV